MTKLDDLALVVELACLTEDRNRVENAALLRVAARVDAEWNAQRTNNPKLPPRGCWPPTPCDYSTTHEKTCACRGDRYAWTPVDGWSRRLDLAVSTMKLPTKG